jgi:hypothetical protein
MSVPNKRPFLGGAAIAAALVVAVAALSAPALADEVSNLAQRLSDLRGDVEKLSARLAEKTADQQDQVRSLSRQKADIELEVGREELRLKKLQASVSEKREALAVENAEGEALKPMFGQQLEKVRGYVQGSLPFRREERLAELDKIEDQVRSGLSTPDRAMGRLWSFMEDEFRLTRESGLYRQSIPLVGGEQLADVARIGMVMLYYQTSDGSVGHTVRRAGQWSFVSVDDAEQAKRIRSLLDQFKKQIRVGYFELPSALPEVQ